MHPATLQQVHLKVLVLQKKHYIKLQYNLKCVTINILSSIRSHLRTSHFAIWHCLRLNLFAHKISNHVTTQELHQMSDSKVLLAFSQSYETNIFDKAKIQNQMSSFFN